jgi:hypothetical protein
VKRGMHAMAALPATPCTARWCCAGPAWASAAACLCLTCGVEVELQAAGLEQGSTARPCTPSLGYMRACGSTKARCILSCSQHSGQHSMR